LLQRSRGSTPSRQRRASQPEVSLAGMVATSFLKRRQQVSKPSDLAPKFINRRTLRRGKCGGSIDETVKRRGVVGSAGVVERGKGTGWIAWKPGRSRSCPRASEPAVRVAGRTMTLAWKVPPTYRERKL